LLTKNGELTLKTLFPIILSLSATLVSSHTTRSLCSAATPGGGAEGRSDLGRAAAVRTPARDHTGADREAGKSAGVGTRLRQKGIELHATNRGGDITYHGQGRLWLPILNLGAIKRDVGWYVRTWKRR